MNGDRPTANGELMSRGSEDSTPAVDSRDKQLKQGREAPSSLVPTGDHARGYSNGDSGASRPPASGRGFSTAKRLDQAPVEILQLIPKDNYLPMAALLSRAAQSCWNGLSTLVEQLAAVPIADQTGEQLKTLANGLPNNQTKANLEKKERLLKFANDQKADFIKLLVLLQWSSNVEDVGKTISINYWLMKRRQAYWDAIASMAILKQDSAGFQMPNPDLSAAAEVLSTRRMRKYSTLGYLPQKNLSSKQILHVLKCLNHSLSVKLALTDSLPPQFRKFRVHDGRVTFFVPNEFELDVSTLEQKPDSPFRMVDFRFSFTPAPHLPDPLHAEIERYANSNIDRDGLHGCFLFLHELSLSYKLAEYHKQAVELARGQWAGHLRVELIRRNLVLQYWTEKQISKSWIEFGIASGRGKTEGASAEPLPHLGIKWMRYGKEVTLSLQHFSDAVVSLEDVLRQIIAQHSTQILDNIYDKLVLAPLYSLAELTLEQTISHVDPENCCLTLQLSQASHIVLKLESVTGSFVISPVTERSERLQYEINRTQHAPEEIASKMLNFRCSTAEAAVLAAISGTRWQPLRAFRFSPSEVKLLFGGPVVRLNLFRQVPWGQDYFLAITHEQNGDHWWLLQQSTPDSLQHQPQYRVLRSQRIEVQDEISAASLDLLAGYATGLICLQRNADYLSDHKHSFELPPFPSFEKHYVLPELVFELGSAAPLSSATAVPLREATPRPITPTKSIKLHFGGVDQSSDRVAAIAHFQNHCSRSVIKHLDNSVLDPGVRLHGSDGTAIIRIETSITEPAVPTIMDKALGFEKIVSTVEQIHRLPGLTLKALSSSSFTIAYQRDPPSELIVTVTFGGSERGPRVEFTPAESNPHHLLATQSSRLFAVEGVPFASQVQDLLTSLNLTLPLVTFLHKLQQKHGLDATQPPQTTIDNDDQRLRVHVLVRSATAFAIQYFTPAKQKPSDVLPGSQPHLLARLEILPHVNASKKPMWLVRAALEEFQSYARPSYSTPGLRTRFRQEIFSRPDGQVKWLPLDSAAACMADQPEPLLEAAHNLLCDWVKQSAESEGAKDAKGKLETSPGNAANLSGNKAKTASTKAATNNARSAPNGGVKAPRPGNNNANVSRSGPGKSGTNPPKKNEVITLD